MIKIEKLETYGWEAAIRGMRNPMNSWDKKDSYEYKYPEEHENIPYMLGKNDMKLAKQLVKSGTDHRKFMRMITVTMDITAPLYWWKEFDTYKVGTVANSCSTMHKITEKELTIDDFSDDCLTFNGRLGINVEEEFDDYVITPAYIIDITIRQLNALINLYKNYNNIKSRNMLPPKKNIWKAIIQMLPSSYNQKRTISLNYEVLLNMYNARHSHKLSEWIEFCSFINDYCPYFFELRTNQLTKEECKTLLNARYGQKVCFPKSYVIDEWMGDKPMDALGVVDDPKKSRIDEENYVKNDREKLKNDIITKMAEDLNAGILSGAAENHKNDSNKSKMDLIPATTFEGLGRVYTYGANLYGPNTWQQVELNRYLAAAIRHYVEMTKDPLSVDSESGLRHSEHFLCNASIINDIIEKLSQK